MKRNSKLLNIETFMTKTNEDSNWDFALPTKNKARDKRMKFRSQSPMITATQKIKLKGKTVTNKDLQKKLDYNVLPSQSIQEKIDYLISPYNPRKTISKYINYEEPEPGVENITKKWKRLANLIINEDEGKFRKDLITINNTLYLELSKDLQSKLKNSKQNKWCTKAKKNNGGRYVNYESLASLVQNVAVKQLNQNKSLKNLFDEKTLTSRLSTNMEANDIRIRKALLNIREKKEKKAKQQSQNNEPKPIQFTTTMISEAASVNSDSRRKANTEDLALAARVASQPIHMKTGEKLDLIPDLNSSDEWEPSEYSNSSLIEKLVKGDHNVYKHGGNRNHLAYPCSSFKCKKVSNTSFKQTDTQTSTSTHRYSAQPNPSQNPTATKMLKLFLKSRQKLNFPSINDHPLSKLSHQFKLPESDLLTLTQPTSPCRISKPSFTARSPSPKPSKNLKNHAKPIGEFLKKSRGKIGARRALSPEVRTVLPRQNVLAFNRKSHQNLLLY